MDTKCLIKITAEGIILQVKENQFSSVIGIFLSCCLSITCTNTFILHINMNYIEVLG